MGAFTESSTVPVPRISIGSMGWFFMTKLYLVLVGQICAFSANATSSDEVWLPTDLIQRRATVSVELNNSRTAVFNARYEDLNYGLVGARGRSVEGDRLTVVLHGDRILSGDIYAGGGHFRLVPAEGPARWVREDASPADSAFLPALEAKDDVLIGGFPPVTPGKAAQAAPGIDGVYQIDLIVLYTKKYQDFFGGALNARREAQRLVFIANSYFDTSKIPVRYRLVNAELYLATDESSVFARNLNSLVLDEGVRALRDRYFADLVVLMRTLDGSADICGLSTGFNNLERSDPPLNVNPERDAFAVAGGGACGDYVLAHELGHNLGAGHAFVINPTAFYWKVYSHGALCGNAGEGLMYTSVMYGNPNAFAGGSRLPPPRGDFFSNPELTLDGIPCGVRTAVGTEVTDADNAHAIAEAAPYVAAYREPITPGDKSRSLLLIGGLTPIHHSFLLVFLLLRLAGMKAANRKQK